MSLFQGYSTTDEITMVERIKILNKSVIAHPPPYDEGVIETFTVDKFDCNEILGKIKCNSNLRELFPTEELEEVVILLPLSQGPLKFVGFYKRVAFVQKGIIVLSIVNKSGVLGESEGYRQLVISLDKLQEQVNELREYRNNWVTFCTLILFLVVLCAIITCNTSVKVPFCKPNY